MRIFYASGASPNAFHISDSTLWSKNLCGSLVDMGHDVTTFSRDVTWHFTKYKNYRSDPVQQAEFLEYKSFLQRELMREITAEHRKQPIDLFFSYFWSEICDPLVIEQIKSLGIKTVNWYCNGSYQFDLVAELAPHYDFCLVPEKFRLQNYREIGACPIYCQEAANPNIYKPYELPREFDVTFVGQCYGDRPGYVRHLVSEDIAVHVWGPGWQRIIEQDAAAYYPGILQKVRTVGSALLHRGGRHEAKQRLSTLLNLGKVSSAQRRAQRQPIVGGVLSDNEMIQIYSRSKINLGFSSCGETHSTKERILQIRLRDFEVPMSGGFYMVEYMEELEEFFNIGKEIVCYTDREDLTDKIKYYLRHDDEREAIRKAGFQRCLRDHTWQNRFQMAFEEMGLS